MPSGKYEAETNRTLTQTVMGQDVWCVSSSMHAHMGACTDAQKVGFSIPWTSWFAVQLNVLLNASMK